MKKTRLIKLGIGLTMLIMTFSSCKKEEPKIFGCMDSASTNYNASATDDNGTCEYQGEVTFWYNSNGSQATVNVGGQTGSVTQYYSTYNPTCGSSGCANFTLPIGSYSYTASSTWSTWSGNVTVTTNGCTLMLLN